MDHSRQLSLKLAALGVCGFLLLPLPACASGVFSEGLSQHPEVRKAEEQLEERLKKPKPDELSDAYYQAGKSAFNIRDYKRAEYYLNESLLEELKANRTEQLIQVYVALAIVHALQGRNEQAHEQYKQALALAEKHRLNEYAQMILDSIGVLAARLNKLDEAEQYHKKAFELASQDKNVPTQVIALVNRAAIARRRKQPEQSLELLSQALEISKAGEPGRELGNALLSLAGVQMELGKYEESNSTYKRAIEVFRDDLDTVSQAQACFRLAENYFDYQEIFQAKSYYEQAIEALQEEPPGDLLISALMGLGSAEADLGKFEDASKAHTKALELARSRESRTRELEAILQLGNDYLLQGSPETGLHKLLEGEKLLGEGVAPSLQGVYFMGIGRCYAAVGHFESAFKYYQAALKLFEQSRDQDRQALTLNTLAVLCLDAGKPGEFDSFYKQAKEIFTELENNRELAILDYNLAQFYITQRRLLESVDLFANSLRRIRQTGDKVCEGRILRGLGLAQLLLNHPQKALEHYQEAMKIADHGNSIEAQWDCKLGLGKCYKRLGLNDLALKNLKDATDLVERERGMLTRDSFKTHQIDFRKDCFAELIDLYVKLNKPYDAIEVAEKGRARAFLDMLSSRRSRRVDEFAVPLAFNVGGPSDKAVQPALLAMAQPGTRGVTALPKLRESLDATAISPVNANPPDIEEIKQLISQDRTTIVQYFILQDKILVWIIDPDTTIRMLPPLPVSERAITGKVLELHQAITDQPKSKEEADALAVRRQGLLQEMYMLLVAPIEVHLPKEENSIITIVPHSVLFSVPFAALMRPDGKFLIEKHTLAYTPAIGVMRATQKLQGKTRTEKDRLLALGNPIIKEIAFLGALPYSEKEVNNIAKIFGPENSTVKIGKDANRKTFLELAPKYSDIHLATHGLIDEEHPMQSSLVLAPTAYDDGLLSVRDILAMQELKARLVVLSACQTGRGKITGDGVVGLSRAFIIAGTPSVMVSQWNVDDIMTEYQMKHFYKSYLDGEGKAKSLRAAQLATIRFLEGANTVAGRRANPRYWAAFQLIGQPN